MRFLRMAAFGVAALTLALTVGAVQAHEGHDHGDETKAAPTVAAPRATSSSPTFELVAVARNGALTVFVDNTATNEPVADATV